ncbi:uncharacterized protein K489DRAFT_410165 [Dissoconium aciculare CBS 342.82]|uniref:Thioredoxin domain-containing protein n=1 Tax=Dissoconium aciculare CBS 342.82 TaxID=1314786 RepID=A0A6J3M4Y7_9PEZI|nr:uncharacterized protein K489DRAFT_410165 [Dissoconium aciculare CBS 342.82]KAF1823095.1 hypothetical protein K489DRAFT_410165 [Dissoconium aciculare CBS 342.82]
MVFTELTSKDDFEKAIKTEGKYVIVYVYEGAMPPQAEEYAAKFSSSTAAYKLDSNKYGAAKEYHKVTTLPTVIAFKDGKEIKRATNEAERKELAATLSS